jgi:anti-anti-sigma factor
MTTPDEDTAFYVLDEEVPVVIAEEEIDYASAPVFAAAIDQATAASPSVVVDLTDCPFMDSSGLQVLLKAQKPGIRLALSCPSDGSVARLIEIAARELVEVHESRAAAIAAVVGGSERPVG